MVLPAGAVRYRGPGSVRALAHQTRWMPCVLSPGPVLIVAVALVAKLGLSHKVDQDDSATATLAADAVLIDLNKTIKTNSPLMNGAHFSPLNHQIQVIYANMVFDESFEQSYMNGCQWLNSTAERLKGLRHFNGGICMCGSSGCQAALPLPSSYGNFQNHSWVNIGVNSNRGSHRDIVTNPCSSPEGAGAGVSSCAYNGNVSFKLAGVGSGVQNRGLYKQGFAFEVQRYSGYFFIRSSNAIKLKVALADDGVEIVSQSLSFSGGNWSRLHFSLDCPRTTACKNFAAGTPPLWCSCSTEECGTCIRCGGELNIVLVEGSEVDLDFVWLAPDNRAQLVETSDPEDHRAGELLRQPLEIAKSMGHKMLRYGGTFSICNQWKNFRGPAYLRQPYNNGVQSHGGSTRGIGVLEVQGMAEALNMTAVLGLGYCGLGSKLIMDHVDLISYAFAAADGSQGHWGKLRAEDGHPEPYKITHVQLGNEEAAWRLVGRFAAGAAAMEGRAAQLGHGGELTYVLGSDMRSDAGSSVVIDGNTSIVLQEIKDAGLCSQVIWDWHVQPSVVGYNISKDFFHLKEFETMLVAHDCPCRVAVLEENNCQAHFTRALADAFTSNYLQTQPLVAMQATSQLWSRAGNFNDGCGEGHVYTLPNMTWLSPPGWASSMTFTSFQPQAKSVIWTRELARTGYPYQTVDVFAATSNDGKDVTLRLVNAGNQSRALSLRLVDGSSANFVDGYSIHTEVVVEGTAKLSSLTSPLTGADYINQSGGVNPLYEPLLISPKTSVVDFDVSGKTPWLLPAQAFQVLTFRLKSDDV